jgi:nitroimidazol reductase NimA-like FMN-containing flavoprotein (pyridoxamine 5'-phosphate oxidase superfamily)
MESKPLDSAYTKIRRKQKAVNDEAWIKKFLHQAPYGVLATAVQDQPFVSTKLFVYDEQRHVIYVHSADQGRAPDNIRANPNVCFTATQMGRLLPGMKASDFGVEYASVVIFGQARLVEDQPETIEVLQMIMDKYAPHLQAGVDYPVITAEELRGLAVYRIEILGWSGKSEQVPTDFPGAYEYKAD